MRKDQIILKLTRSFEGKNSGSNKMNVILYKVSPISCCLFLETQIPYNIKGKFHSFLSSYQQFFLNALIHVYHFQPIFLGNLPSYKSFLICFLLKKLNFNLKFSIPRYILALFSENLNIKKGCHYRQPSLALASYLI